MSGKFLLGAGAYCCILGHAQPQGTCSVTTEAGAGAAGAEGGASLVGAGRLWGSGEEGGHETEAAGGGGGGRVDGGGGAGRGCGGAGDWGAAGPAGGGGDLDGQDAA